MPDAATIPARIDAAAALCADRGARLTDLRREVLALILAAEAPPSAYDLLAKLRCQRAGAAPPTVYRALEFLLAQGLVHRVERLGAFVGCDEPAHHHAHPVHFLICRGCGDVREMEDAGLERMLATIAQAAGFAPERATVEIEGLCAPCSQSPRRSATDRIGF